MSDASLNLQTAAGNSSLNADEVFWLLGAPARRRLLLALRSGAGLAASQLCGPAGLRQSVAEKHLTRLLKSGLLAATPDQQDKRRMLYRLAPSVSVVKTETGTMMDFGCCVMRV